MEKSVKKLVKQIIKKVTRYHRTAGKYIFANRYKGEENVCIILAGYKQYVWKAVFGRVKKFAPDNVHVCIISSGLFLDELSEIAEKNNWSYLSTKKNNLCLAQNIAMLQFPKAEGFFKLDEDMFVTKEFFTNMIETYNRFLEKERYDIGMVSALTPLNGYGYIRLLEKIGKLHLYEEKFGKAYYSAGVSNDRFLMDKNVPIFMNTIEEFKNIDELSSNLAKDKLTYSICPIRYSIGAIYYKRAIWESMEMYRVPFGGFGLGQDERDICAYCLCSSKAIVVSENCAVAHLGYGSHMSNSIKEYYMSHRELFEIEE